MGYCVRVKCNCTDEQFHIGVGIRDVMATHQREVAYCPSCKTFQIVQGDMMCKCGTEMELFYTMDMFDSEQNQTTCPNCGQIATISMEGYWD